jgi:hypothetical protein
MPDSGSLARTEDPQSGWAGTYGARASLGARTTMTRPLPSTRTRETR